MFSFVLGMRDTIEVSVECGEAIASARDRFSEFFFGFGLELKKAAFFVSGAAVGFDSIVELIVGDVSEAIGAQVGGGWRQGARIGIVDISVAVLCDSTEDLEVLRVDEKDFWRSPG